MPGDESFDFRGTDTLTAPVDHFFDTTREGDVPLVIDSGQIPGPEKPVSREDFFVFFRVVVITGEDPWSLENQFAFCSRREVFPFESITL